MNFYETPQEGKIPGGLPISNGIYKHIEVCYTRKPLDAVLNRLGSFKIINSYRFRSWLKKEAFVPQRQFLHNK